jgi:hypothetical protein
MSIGNSEAVYVEFGENSTVKEVFGSKIIQAIASTI